MRNKILNEGILDTLSKVYEKYKEVDKTEIHYMVISHMIKFKKSVLELKTMIPDNFWNILEIMKRHAIEEDMKIREETLDTLLPICSHDEKAILLDLVKPHL